MEAHLLTEHACEDRHAKALCHGLAEDGEAAVGDCGPDEGTDADDHESQGHLLQVGPHLLLVCLEEATHRADQSNRAHRHRGAVDHGTKDGRNEERPLRPVVAQQSSHGDLVILRDVFLAIRFCILLPLHTLGLRLAGIRGGAPHDVLRSLFIADGGRILLFILCFVGGFLRSNQGIVGALLLHQGRMLAMFHQGPTAQHVNEVGVAHCTEAVGNAHNPQAIGRVRADTVDGGLDHLLGGVVKSTGRLVQEEEGRLLKKGPGNGDALLLTSGQLAATATDEGVVFLGQAVDKAELSVIAGLHEVLLAGGRVALHDVVADGAGEKNRLLAHIADATPQGRDLEVCHVLAVHQHGPGVRVVEPLQQSHHRGLPRAGLTDHRDLLPTLDAKGQPVQDLDIGASWIGEVHILEIELLDFADVLALVIQAALDVGLVLQGAEEATGSRLRCLHGLEARVQVANHEASDEDAEEDGHDRAGLPKLSGGWVQLFVVPQGHAEPEGQAVSQEDDHHGVAHACTDLEAIPHPSTACLHQGSRELLQFAVLAAESHYGSHGGQALLHHGRSLGIPALRLVLDLLDGFSHEGGADAHKGQNGAHHQCDEPTHSEGTAEATKEG
mmetsp:Transcript_147522/g.209440  ORF Transcript_147522/g.209440 Transcript_147522/m.209440 type:complete len:612 (-) Transcript_147522:454-2289(-)